MGIFWNYAHQGRTYTITSDLYCWRSSFIKLYKEHKADFTSPYYYYLSKEPVFYEMLSLPRTESNSLREFVSGLGSF